MSFASPPIKRVCATRASETHACVPVELMKLSGAPATHRCKACVAKGAEREREVAVAAAASGAVGATGSEAANSGRGSSSDGANGDVHECASCKQSLPSARFNKNQLRNKGPGKQRCQECVAASELKDAGQIAASQQAKLDDLRRDAARADATGTAGDRLKAASAACAAEAELVTGLKPMVIGRGRGGPNGWRGRSRGGGAKRGR